MQKKYFLYVGTTAVALCLLVGGVALAQGGKINFGFKHNANIKANGNMKANMPAAVGTVSAISGNTITLTGGKNNATSYTVNAASATVTKITAVANSKPTSSTISISGIATGDHLMVFGTVSGSSIAATKITDTGTNAGWGGPGRGGMGKMNPPAVMGTVSSISGNTITLTGKNNTSYTVDASNATITKFTAASGSRPTSSTISIAQIASGDTLVVFGTTTGTSITATKIIDGAFPQSGGMGGWQQGMGGKFAPPAAAGKVTAVSGNTVTLTGRNNTSYTVDATNAKISKITPSATAGTKPTTAAITVSGISVGDNIMVQGTVSGTNVTATQITDGMSGGRMGGHFGQQQQQN